MVAGFERYFQIARCFRDEDTRGDRQPEFTQLDMEMSFVTADDVLNLTEELFTALVEKLFPNHHITQKPFPRLRFHEVMEKHESDKPDLRENKSDPNELAFAFVVDFPMFEWRESEKRWDAVHHPFTMPQVKDRKEFLAEFKKDPSKILAFQYDLVLNGYEIGGGSIRIHDPELLSAVFEVMGHKKNDIEARFGHLLEAFKMGVPPHGGIAPGIDRLIMALQGEPNIREVIAFPKTGDARDPMMESPSEIDKKQLKELHLKVEKDK
jgi:aspartyl-tRNA synthetase